MGLFVLLRAKIIPTVIFHFAHFSFYGTNIFFVENIRMTCRLFLDGKMFWKRANKEDHENVDSSRTDVFLLSIMFLIETLVRRVPS